MLLCLGLALFLLCQGDGVVRIPMKPVLVTQLVAVGKKRPLTTALGLFSNSDVL